VAIAFSLPLGVMSFGFFFGFFSFNFPAKFFVFGVFGFGFAVFAFVVDFFDRNQFVVSLVIGFGFVVVGDDEGARWGGQRDGVGRGCRSEQHQRGEEEGQQDRQFPHGPCIGAVRNPP
jgi:hypothetical protein